MKDDRPALPSIRAAAELAKLELTAGEERLIERELLELLDFAAPLLELDTTGTEPSGHGLELGNVLREDRASPCKMRLSRATQEGLIPVPGAIGGEGGQ